MYEQVLTFRFSLCVFLLGLVFFHAFVLFIGFFAIAVINNASYGMGCVLVHKFGGVFWLNI